MHLAQDDTVYCGFRDAIKTFSRMPLIVKCITK